MARAELPDATPPPAPVRTGFGFPVLPPPMAFIELLVLLVIPATLDYAVKDFPSLTEMHPHYFWLPILLLSLQYGTVSGLMTAGVAIGFQALIGWPDHEIGENHFSYLLRIWAQPMLWVAAALVLGQFRSRQIERKLELVQRVEELASQRAAIADFATNLRARCDLLERRLATGTTGAARDLLGALGQLGAAGETDAPRLLDRTLELALGRCRASLFKREGQELALVHAHNWQPQSEAQGILAAESRLASAVARDGRRLCVMTPGEEQVLEGSALAAVPVLSAQNGAIIGVLRLDHCEPAELDGDTVARLDALAAFLAPLLEGRALRTTASGETAIRPDRTARASEPRPRVWRQLRRKPERAAGPSARSTTA